MRAPVLRSSPRRVLPAWVHKVGASGAPEALTGLLILTYNEAFPDPAEVRSVAGMASDFALCLFGGLAGRWPRVGTIGVAVALLASVITTPNIHMAWFALFIPLVSNGAHGRRVLRDAGAVAYFTLSLVKTLPLTDTVGDAVQTVVLWSALIGLAWGSGQTVNQLRTEGLRQAALREDALRSQRRSIARDLHDTVSYATTTMIMRAEQVKLRTHDDPQLLADLDFIISTGRRSVRDLRGMMETLRRNDPALDAAASGSWRLVRITDVLRDRQAELAAHGLHLDVQTDADLDQLPESVRETLGKLIVEATSNMVKHAGRGPCRILIEVGTDSLEAVFTNPLRAGGAAPRPGTGLGIIGATERVEAMGGELEATAASGTWLLRAQLPLGE